MRNSSDRVDVAGFGFGTAAMSSRSTWVVQVRLEALLDRDAEKVEPAVQAALGRSVHVGWYS
jgi:hypothetical protein